MTPDYEKTKRLLLFGLFAIWLVVFFIAHVKFKDGRGAGVAIYSGGSGGSTSLGTGVVGLSGVQAVGGWTMIGNRFVRPSLDERFQRAWDSLNWPVIRTSAFAPRVMNGHVYPPIDGRVFVDTIFSKNAWWDSLSVLKNDPHWRDSLKVRKW